MIWVLILLLSLLVFTSRYVFLEPRLPLKLPQQIKVMLNYSAPAVMTAIWAPIVLFPEGELAIGIDNEYLVAAAIAVILAWVTRHVLLTTIVSMAFFMFLRFVW